MRRLSDYARGYISIRCACGRSGVVMCDDLILRLGDLVPSDIEWRVRCRVCHRRAQVQHIEVFGPAIAGECTGRYVVPLRKIGANRR